MGTGTFSPTASLLSLLQQTGIGIGAGVVLGYLAALLIARERWSFLMEYAPVVTLVAVIGAYFAADGLQASGFMAVFVFGIMLGDKGSFGFKDGLMPNRSGLTNLQPQWPSSCGCSFSFCSVSRSDTLPSWTVISRAVLLLLRSSW